MPPPAVARRTLYVLFFLSGISGLIYEIVWLRMLIRILGSTAYATSVVLAAFMAGLALGSYLVGRFAAGAKNPLRIYALLELGVGVTALVLTLLLGHLTPLYRAVYNLAGESRLALTLFQSGLMFGVLLVPTILMGGTLPVLSAYTKAHQIAFGRRIALLYGLNTLGAVAGVVSSGLYTIGAWGETATLAIAVFITVLVAALAYTLSKGRPADTAAARGPPAPAGVAQAPTVISPYAPSTRRLVGLAYALSGFAAMAYEIVWTRIFQIQIGTSIYAFSIMLAFYLAGIGLGSLWAGRRMAETRHPLQVFALAQLAIAVYGLVGMYLNTLFIPVSLMVRLNLIQALVMPLVVVCPITLVLGVLFPVVSRCYVPSEAEVSRAVGRLYGLNTLGCIAGSLVCGFVMLSALGTRGSMLTLAGLNLALGLVLLLREAAGFNKAALYASAAAGILLTALLAWAVPDPFRSAVAKAVHRYFGPAASQVEIYFHQESVAATTTALGIPDRPFTKHLWVNGIGMTILCPETKVMAHLPLLLHSRPEKMLVVCFGMGTTARSAWAHGTLQVDVVELVPQVYECFRFFHANGPEVLADPRVRHYVDDGRNFLLMRPKTYDVITMDPAPPIWSAGTVNLYTREFFELCRARLNPGGVMCLWVPSAEASELRMIMKTFQTVFPATYVWRGLSRPPIGFFLIGFKESSRQPDFSRFAKAREDPRIVADLNEWGSMPEGPEVILSLRVAGPAELARSVADAPVITDDHPYTEFPLWRSLFEPQYKTKLILSP